MAVKNNEILIGSKENPILALDNDSIISINGNLACDLLCETIPIDTLEIQCRYDRMRVAFSPIDYNGMSTSSGKKVYARSAGTEDVLNIPYASGLWYYNGGAYIGKFYVVDAQRTGKNVYTIKAQSAIGILDGMPYYGKLFVNTPLSDAINDIILTDGLNRTETTFLLELADSIIIGDGLSSISVTGWIPVCSKRAALHHILFAHVINIQKSEDDSFLITKISNAAVGGINPNDEYDSGVVDLTERVKSVEVTEHSFIMAPNTERVILYDNTKYPIGVETIVVFDSAPIIALSLAASGTLVIRSSNENCAVVSGVGVLTGIPYVHTTRVVSRINESIADGKSIQVSDATLVNVVNSNAVTDRLYAYYTTKRDMQIPIVLSGQRCGMRYSCTSPFGEEKDAFITSMVINASAIAKADCKMVSGYEHPKDSGELTHMILLTKSGTFNVSETIMASESPVLKIVLIGGGQGGEGGESGEEGKVGAVKSIDELSQPGKCGKNGSPGKILHVEIDKKNLSPSYEYSCGAGGYGGSWCRYGTEFDAGKVGEATTFGGFSSDMGIIPTVGFQDPYSGDVYGGPSPDFSDIIKSGRGGGMYWDNGTLKVAKPEPGVCILDEVTALQRGFDAGVPIELPGGNGPILEAPVGTSPYSAWSGGGSGGPCFNQDNPNVIHWFDGQKSTISGSTVTLGAGGRPFNGQTMPSPFLFSKTAYGQGGLGGHGGPGAGSSGVWLSRDSGITMIDGTPGDFGRGAYGGRGAEGCILVYY